MRKVSKFVVFLKDSRYGRMEAMEFQLSTTISSVHPSNISRYSGLGESLLIGSVKISLPPRLMNPLHFFKNIYVFTDLKFKLTHLFVIIFHCHSLLIHISRTKSISLIITMKITKIYFRVTIW